MFTFKQLPADVVKSRLEMIAFSIGFEIDANYLNFMAGTAAGNMRQGINTLEQAHAAVR